MQNYRTILDVVRLRCVEKLPRSACQGKVKLGNGTYQLIETRFKESGKTYEELKAMEPEELEKLFYPESKKRKDVALPDFEKIYSKVKRGKAPSTLQIEWMEYKKENYDGYQYTQFCKLFNDYVRETYGDDVAMAVNRVPGEKVYIDWVGQTPKVVFDQESQKLKEAHIYVTSVGVSNMIFAKAYENEKLPNFIDGTKCALEYYGAVPRFLCPDNLKAAVIKHTKDELIINAAYEDLENHYDVIILPPPSLKPKGKATCERYVGFIEDRIIPQLKVYPSFEALNSELFRLVDDANNEYSKKLKAIKKETFEAYDKPKMKALPPTSFSPVDYKFVSKVPNNYHVEYDGHYYSIPFSYANKSVMIKASFTEIKITDENNNLIFKHPRSYKVFPKYITEESHMPSSHRYWKEINESTTDQFLSRAKRIGPNMEKLVFSVLHSFKHEVQSYNSLNGILHSCDGLSYVLCDEAAKECIDAGCASYSYFKRMLNHKVNSKKKENDKLPEHTNIRGKDFYK